MGDQVIEMSSKDKRFMVAGQMGAKEGVWYDRIMAAKKQLEKEPRLINMKIYLPYKKDDLVRDCIVVSREVEPFMVTEDNDGR